MYIILHIVVVQSKAYKLYKYRRTCDMIQHLDMSLHLLALRSKIGAVLHLRWREEDGSFFHLDCDLTVPTFPTQDRYDGGTDDVVRYLSRERPVGWREECGKLLNLSAMAGSTHLIDPSSWQIKMRLINRSTVLPSQVGTSTDLSSSLPQSLLFLDDQTLRGRKR